MNQKHGFACTQTHGRQNNMKKRDQIRCAALLTACLMASLTFGGKHASGAVFDLRNDWSNSSNPNGVWTLLSGTEVLPRFHAWPGDPFSPPQDGWGSGFIPFWFKSTSEANFIHDWNFGDIIVHTVGTEVDNYPASVLWTSPLTGRINILGNVWEGRDWNDCGSGSFRANQWNLYLRENLISSGSIEGGDPYDSAKPFPFGLGSGGTDALTGILVSAGDVVRLELIGTGLCGDYVGVNFHIETSPPPSLTLLRNADQTLTVSWRGVGALEQTESLTPPSWQPATSQANPQTNSTTAAMKFYRVKAD